MPKSTLCRKSPETFCGAKKHRILRVFGSLILMALLPAGGTRAQSILPPAPDAIGGGNPLQGLGRPDDTSPPRYNQVGSGSSTSSQASSSDSSGQNASTNPYGSGYGQNSATSSNGQSSMSSQSGQAGNSSLNPDAGQNYKDSSKGAQMPSGGAASDSSLLNPDSRDSSLTAGNGTSPEMKSTEAGAQPSTTPGSGASSGQGNTEPGAQASATIGSVTTSEQGNTEPGARKSATVGGATTSGQGNTEPGASGASSPAKAFGSEPGESGTALLQSGTKKSPEVGLPAGGNSSSAPLAVNDLKDKIRQVVDKSQPSHKEHNQLSQTKQAGSSHPTRSSSRAATLVPPPPPTMASVTKNSLQDTPSRKAMALINKGNYVEAESALHQIVSETPEDLHSQYLLAVTLVLRRKFDQARSTYKFIIDHAHNQRLIELAEQGLRKLD